MWCHNCGNTDLLRKFKCCPECGSPLPHAQNIPSKFAHGVVPTLLQQSDASARHNHEHGIDHSEIKGKSHQHGPLTGQQRGPIQQPNKKVEGGTWYNGKRGTQQQEFTGIEKNKKNQNEEETRRINTKQESFVAQRPPSLQQVKPEAGVTVVFDVLLASNLKMSEESFFIRAHGPDFGDFQQNCVDMRAVEVVQSQDREKLVHFRGQFTITLNRAHCGTAYKYLVDNKGELYDEELPEFPPKYGYSSIVNRSLKIPESHIEPGAIWNQYDGVAYVYGDKDIFSKVSGYFSEKYRTKALLRFLPKWKGFFVNEPTENMDATEALTKLQDVVTCLSRVSIEVKGDHLQCQPTNFDIRKALIDYLRPKMEKNVAILADGKVGSSARVSAVVSSLAMVILVKRYSIELEREEVKSLLSCLSLEVDQAEKKCSAYEVVLEEFSSELRKFAAGAIESLCNQLIKQTWTFNPEWLLAVPLLHFLRGDTKPFEEPDLGGSPQMRAWWGAEKLNIEDFQRNADKQDFLDVLVLLASAFEADSLLKRTFLLVTPVWQLHRIVSTRMFHVTDFCVYLVTFLPRGTLIEKERNSIEQCIEAMINILETDNETNSNKLEVAEFTACACLNLVEAYLDGLPFRDGVDLICLAIQLLFSSIQQWRNTAVDNQPGEKENKPQEKSSQRDCFIHQISRKLGSKLKKELDTEMPDYNKRDALLRELEVWSVLLRVSDGTQGFEEYRRFLTEEFMHRVKRMKETCLIQIFCELHLDGYDRAVGESISKLAFEAVEKIAKSRQEADARRAFYICTKCTCSDRADAGDDKYGQLLSVLLTKSWPKATQLENSSGLDPGAVEFFLTWSLMAGYFHFFGDESGRGSILTDEGQETLAMAQWVLMAIVECLSNASVTVEILVLLQKYKQEFLELLKSTFSNAKEETMGRKVKETEKILAKRIEEIEEFQTVKAEVVSFVNMCDLIQPVNITSIKVKTLYDVSQCQLRHLCERNSKGDKKIEVKFFELPSVVKNVFSPLNNVQESLTFQDLWIQFGKKAQTARKNDEANRPHLSIAEVVENVWKPAFEDWNQLAASTLDGTISLENVDKFFDSYKDRKLELEQELLHMFQLSQDQTAGNKKKLMSSLFRDGAKKLRAVAADRAVHIQRYQQFHQFSSIADTIWEFKDIMGFTGDFKIIEHLRNELPTTEFKQKPLKSIIKKKYFEACPALECLDVGKVQCFKAFVDSRRLVKWLRSTIKSTQELKVLVDLALISAGESDIETDRISSLHTSCLGFAPLIFDLRESRKQKVDFDQLMKACDPVWKAVEMDDRLPQKLYDTSRHLEWLKAIKVSHGSVAMTSLAQAKNINSSGVYLVGHLNTKNGVSAEQGRRLSLNNVVQLTVRTKDGSEEVQRKIYSVDELNDLQSKLMLITGKAEKGKDEVEKFVKNLEGVMRLATAYINLCESGFVHCLQWNKEFKCCKDQLEGESIAKELADESTAMENCYFNWKKMVSDARRKYQELNFFTTQQLMLLRKEIAEVCHSHDQLVSNLQVLTLLESVRPNVDTEQVKSAIQRAFRNTDILYKGKGTAKIPSFTQVPSSEAVLSTRRTVCDDNGYESASVSKIQSFLNAASDNGYSQQVALAALASLGVEADEEDLLLWCLEEADEADIEALEEEARQNPIIAREIFSNTECAEMQAEDESKTVTEGDKLIELPSKLPEDTADSGINKDVDNEAEINQYLTLAQLGNFLRELSCKGKETSPRSFPAFLKRGRPNLVLVPKDDVLATVLALYMHDKNQPLPSHEEVLICTPETTTEEIELLWRRATGDVEGRFFCLVYADQLDFSVSKQAVDMLCAMTQGLAGKTGENYGLVVICSSENEDRANIVAALDLYRAAAPPCPLPGDLKSYLKYQFRAPPSQNEYINSSNITWVAAGSLDPEKVCVRVVSSKRGGLGKTLFVRRLTDQLTSLVNNNMVLTNLQRHDYEVSLNITIPLHGNSADSSMLVDSLLPHAVKANVPLSRIFHLDVSPSMRRGLDTLLFNLLVLGYLCDKMGRVWRRRNTDLYVIEITTSDTLPMGFPREEEAKSQGRRSGRSFMSERPFLDLLPTIECETPRTVQCRLSENKDPNDLNPLLDIKEFRDAPFQRVYQYLKMSSERASLDNFAFLPGNIDEDRKACLTLLLGNCGIPDPSWSEIRHFVSFLNSQLSDCEQSAFCDMQLMKTVLAGSNVPKLIGFRSFVVRFMMQMSRDFATPSLTEENTVFLTEDNADLERREIEQFQLRRRWESSPHPYLFFNQDHITMTFLGFYINSAGDLVDPEKGVILQKGLMSKELRNGLQGQGVDFTTNTENFKKVEKIGLLCSVMGVQSVHDPDRAYELTTDNVKKILAIHMRFRCNIPVIIMGETGCGKTSLVRYMCGLQAGPKGPRNMLLVKVHGGTTFEDIKLKVHQAEEMARQNQDKNIDTVVFFDEANTTEALSMIKEVIVDRRINGRPIGQGLKRLQFIAACNPYKRHTDDMIHKLESAGLGYHVKTNESEDRLGHIPLRHLVYRVHALPGSMRPLIWDFGQLKPEVERLYTNQIVNRFILHERQLPGNSLTVKVVSEVLAASQKYMRDQSDECSFVSLRDVERAMQVMVWFYNHLDTLGRLMRKVISEKRREEGQDSDEDKEEPTNPITRALVLAIGVCYHAKLQERRQEYRTIVARRFKAPCSLPGGQMQILREISSCQKAVLNELELGPNIARNTALSENVFMMVVCIELRIPLFVVGKPGSSKSLAKTVVADNMQGNASRSELFKTFKQVHMASYQCSPLSTPEGVVATFRQCSKLQEGKNPEKFVSVVVLDEVGLAEDSPLMPLKTLHPLLEDGVTSADDVIETDVKTQRVAFIGISNWALDPAKMNRGFMLSRGVPEVGELVDSAMGICSTDKQVKHLIQFLISPLADGYAELYKKQKNFATLKKCGKEEFFGLRDFYSLIKMVYSIAAKSGERPRWHQLEHAIRRNFGGLIEGDPVEIFKRHYQETDEDQAAEPSTTIRLIEASLRREDVADRFNFSENRYLLILTENYAALPIMQQHLLKTGDDAVVIFGSSFPNDQEYTQICRNINRIKVCMETGRTVILLNLESLYESLYDALNQYYVYFGGQKYVDLGLGSHRVKCRVHDDFKLIVIAEKDVVYNKFPIPLINRLEKHYLVTSTSLTPGQMELVGKLRTWASDFSEVTKEGKRKRDFSVGDVFVGYHEDTIPSIVLQVCNHIEEEDLPDETTEDTWEMRVILGCRNMLLEMATPDAIVRLPATRLEGEARNIWNVYFHEQEHSSLAAFMRHVLTLNDAHLDRKRQEGLLIQITTHSRLLSNNDLGEICVQTDFHRTTVDLITLQQFQTEQQFRDSVRTFFESLGGDCPGILFVQCDSRDDNFNLIAGARHILQEKQTNESEMLNLPSVKAVHIVLIVQLPRMVGGCGNCVGFQGGKWMSSHIDELCSPDRHAPSIEQLIDRPISELFKSGSEDQVEDDDETQALAFKLLRNCVQAAACRVDNEAGSPERSTYRIELLLRLLPEDSQSVEAENTFARVLTQRAYHLLKERESKAYNAKEWLQSEALSGTGVQEWGTFRKALWKRVYSVVVPILAEIIALADRDSNLELIANDNTWISGLWLKILADRNISELSYSKMISPVTDSVRERVQIIGSGAGGHRFWCRFPFSFLIKQRVQELLKDAFSISAQSSTTLVESLRGLIDNSEFGPLLRELPHRHFLLYLIDFIHMVYRPTSDSEHELVYEAILSSARDLGTLEDEEGNEVIDIALVHAAYSRVQSRLRCFAKLVQVYPDVVPRLREIFREKEPEEFLDVVALQVCLETLSPSSEILLKLKSRRAWCDRVLSIRPAVEDMMRKERFGPVTKISANYGEKSTVLLGQCRSMWQRVGAVTLFVEHVALCSEDNATAESVVRLWKVLGEESDFSSLRSLQIIEKFLISYHEDIQMRVDEKTASELCRRCNAFFMELVTIFCFGDLVSKDLEQDALSLLMGYVIGGQSTQTKDFSPLRGYGIDPTPVVRSFLLQQLLRSSSKLVKEHLEAFLRDAQSLKPEPQHIREVCFLYIQCREDVLISRYKAKVADSKLTMKLKHTKKTCDEAFQALATNDEVSFEINANSLEGVAKGRYVLLLVADYLYKWFIEGDSSINALDVKREVMVALLESARRLCVKGSTPQLYLLKQLVRRYGFDCVRTLGGYKELEWILPLGIRQEEDDIIQDRFIVHENRYRALREGIAKTMISGNIKDIISAITETKVRGVSKDIFLLLTLYREITLSNASSVQNPKFEEVKKKLEDFTKNGGHLSVTAQPFATQLLENIQGGQLKELQVYRGKSPQEHTLAEIVIHTSVALQCIGSGSLAQPLYALMTNPSSMKNSFLPTMPEDNFLECISAIAETMKDTGWVGEWYECGNCKHPYFVGECTKPMQMTNCPDCGRVMGGQQHKFLGKYKVSSRKDRTKTGHMLGEPGSRPNLAEPQRKMSPIVCGLLRIIMHSAMVMGACRNAPATSKLINPPCESQLVGQLLWKHLQRDLDVLGSALGRSIDDAALTVHLVLQRMISQNGGQTANARDMRLQSRDSRMSWESDFCSAIIVPVITHLDQNLQKASRLLMEDARFRSDPLVQQLYEFDAHDEDLTQGVIPMSRSLWKYRRQITVENLSNSFQQEILSSGEQRHKVLDAFLKQEHKLRFVQFLPDIIRLQRLLMDRFHRRIDRTDAENYTIRKFLQELPRESIKEEFNNLFQRFKIAWNSCRSFLSDQGRLRVPQDLCNTTMDYDCPIAILLPSTTGMGVCATSLTFFLVNTHDEFLGAYRSATNQDSALDRVSVTEVTMSHLIAYDPERDLLPLILAHCNYSLEVGQETLVHYDWAALERQLIDRFMRGRPFVEFKEERFAFRRDTRDDTVFASLAEKIPQESISRVVEGQIIYDFRSSLPDVCDVLSSLDIAIGFLASSGGQPERPLKWYLHEVLKLPKERGLKSPTAERHCNLSHTLALWRLAALERAKIKSRNKQEPFEQMPEVFKEKLSSSDLAHLNRVLRNIDMDLFLPQLLEMILLNVEKDGEIISTMSFGEYLELCLAEKGLEQIPGTENIPDDIKMMHVKAVWNSAVQLSDDFHKDRQSASA